MRIFAKRFLSAVHAVLAVSACAVATEPSKTYLRALLPYSLGDGAPEFFEAHIVTNIESRTKESLLTQVKTLCVEFPRLDTYVVRVFSTEEAIQLEQLAKGLGRASRGIPPVVREGFIAEINPQGEFVLYPMNDQKRQVATLPRKWCGRN